MGYLITPYHVINSEQHCLCYILLCLMGNEFNPIYLLLLKVPLLLNHVHTLNKFIYIRMLIDNKQDKTKKITNMSHQNPYIPGWSCKGNLLPLLTINIAIEKYGHSTIFTCVTGADPG